MTLEDLNQLSAEAARDEFLKCCGSRGWAHTMAGARPFQNHEQLFAQANRAASTLTDEDWLEAFRAHPKIGERKPAATQTQLEANWSAQEQAAVQSAPANTISQLAQANEDYEARFGFIFIICATGKSSSEMLSILERRLNNDRRTELSIAAEEQRKITRLRLEKLLNQ